VSFDPNPRCECGKVIFLHPERAAFYAVQQAVIHGVATGFYQCIMHEWFWHLTSLETKAERTQWRRELYGQ
jgi:hypothetical protein